MAKVKCLIAAVYKHDGKSIAAARGTTFEVNSPEDILALNDNPGVFVAPEDVEDAEEQIELAFEERAAAKEAAKAKLAEAQEAAAARLAAQSGTDEDRAELEALTVEQLKAKATESEIDLGDATKKDDIIDAILAALDEGEGDNA